MESSQPLSESIIWKLQKDYFLEKGIDAWKSGEVPHYLTSNPYIGKTYAELTLAFLRDLSLKKQSKTPVYLVELGAGHGRFCYHFLKHFEKYYESGAISLPPFKYILTDFSDTNHSFWLKHPRLKPYIDRGWLDVSIFDAETSDLLYLENARVTIGTRDLEQPLMVIANYFFDSIPQELFQIHDNTIKRGFVSVNAVDKLNAIGTLHSEKLERLHLEYSFEDIENDLFVDQPYLYQILEKFKHKINSGHLLFPAIGIDCLERLKKLSVQGLLVLTADNGNHHLLDIENNHVPSLAHHGSFSLSVHYHCFEEYAKLMKGHSLFTKHQHAHLDVGLLLLLENATTYTETIQAYDKFVQELGPDDYFSLKKLVEKHFETMNYHEIISITRLSAYDARIFQQMLPRLFDLLPHLTEIDKLSLLQSISRIWDTYFPLQEKQDLANNLGNLLLNLEFYREAILYFEKSLVIYGKTEHALYNIALCHCLLGERNSAIPFVRECLALTPADEELSDLIQRYSLPV